MPAGMTSPLSILIVEDEPLIAMMLEDFLQELGHRVAAIAESVEGALARVEAGGFDIAILDVHLRGGATSWPVADRMAAAGLPFILATGGHLDPPPARHAGAPVLGKPFTMDEVRAALDAATAALRPL
jgi:DNA-binding response OmpR family regulator